MTIGEKIKQRRIELGMTQEDLALKLGYKSRSSVNKVELSSDLTLKTIRMYADALKLDISYLMGWTDAEGNEIVSEQTLDDVEGTLERMNNQQLKRISLYAQYLMEIKKDEN